MFVKVFDYFILVIIVKTSKFISPILFETHILLDKSSRVIQIPSNLTKRIKL